MINSLYHLAIEISEFSIHLTTYQESLVVRNPSVLMSKLESQPLPKGEILNMLVLPLRRNFTQVVICVK